MPDDLARLARRARPSSCRSSRGRRARRRRGRARDCRSARRRDPRSGSPVMIDQMFGVPAGKRRPVAGSGFAAPAGRDRIPGPVRARRVRASKARTTPAGASARTLSATSAPITTVSRITCGGDVGWYSQAGASPMPSRSATRPLSPKPFAGLAGIGVEREQLGVRGAVEDPLRAGRARGRVRRPPSSETPRQVSGIGPSPWRSCSSGSKTPALVARLGIEGEDAHEGRAVVEMRRSRRAASTWKRGHLRVARAVVVVAAAMGPGDLERRRRSRA